MKTTAGALFLASALLTSTSSTALVQNPPTFRGEATLVPVAVRAIDKTGRLVTDLTQADFTVLEDDVEQPIRLFSTQTYRPDSSDNGLVVRTALSDHASRPNRRVFLILLGRGRLQPPSKGVDGVIHLVRDRLLPQDLVSVMAWDRASEFTTDHAKIVRLLERFKAQHEEIELTIGNLSLIYADFDVPGALQAESQAKVDRLFDGAADDERQVGTTFVSSRTTNVSSGRRSSAPDDERQESVSLNDFLGLRGAQSARWLFTPGEQELDDLLLAILYLGHFEGDKHLVYVSEHGLLLPSVQADERVAQMAADAHVVIDTVHTGGAQIVPLPVEGLVSPIHWAPQTASRLAELTGGRSYWNQLPSTSAAMDDLDQSTRFEYVLGYYPAAEARERSERRISVRVHRPGLTLIYPHTYAPANAVEPFDRERAFRHGRVAAAAEDVRPATGIHVRATAESSRAEQVEHVTVKIHIDPAKLVFTVDAEGHHVGELDVAAFCGTGRDEIVGTSWTTAQLNYTDERMDEIARAHIPITLTIPVTRKAANVKVVVYDYAADLVGSVVAKVK